MLSWSSHWIRTAHLTRRRNVALSSMPSLNQLRTIR
jgi:hypothetical protein